MLFEKIKGHEVHLVKRPLLYKTGQRQGQPRRYRWEYFTFCEGPKCLGVEEHLFSSNDKAVAWVDAHIGAAKLETIPGFFAGIMSKTKTLFRGQVCQTEQK